jgi:hypothetical protein
MPDFLIRNRNEIFVLEHKHKKEGGGGQNDQINEIVQFIGFKEKNKNIHFISLLDGVYFNNYSKKNLRGKIYTQKQAIVKNLNSNKGNYFVNTAGFIKFIKGLG